ADSELDNESKNTLKKLLSTAAKKMAIQNGNTITQFFSPVQHEPDIQTDDACLNELE
ncbi:4085_t:CDS:2, partial [Funneliformis geosporum]